MKVQGKHVILSLISIILGFMISFSYQMTASNNIEEKITDRQWEREFQYRTMLIEQEEKNRLLQQQLYEQQESVRKYEEELAQQEQIYFNLVEDVEKLRMFNGNVSVVGAGIEVLLDDASYVPTNENINQYLVHESHVFKVVNEMLISGADGVAINGQRLKKNSYIYCNGPVINVDGTQHPAPFTITAIGNPEVLLSALNINGGVKDQLVNDNIVVKIMKKNEIIFPPVIGSSLK